MAKNNPASHDINTLYDTINQIIEEARKTVYQTAILLWLKPIGT